MLKFTREFSGVYKSEGKVGDDTYTFEISKDGDKLWSVSVYRNGMMVWSDGYENTTKTRWVKVCQTDYEQLLQGKDPYNL
jgi:hypothetical protein